MELPLKKRRPQTSSEGPVGTICMRYMLRAVPLGTLPENFSQLDIWGYEVMEVLRTWVIHEMKMRLMSTPVNPFSKRPYTSFPADKPQGPKDPWKWLKVPIPYCTQDGRWYIMGGCQNYGPVLGPLNTRCRIILRNQKGTIILITSHMSPMSWFIWSLRKVQAFEHDP